MYSVMSTFMITLCMEGKYGLSSTSHTIRHTTRTVTQLAEHCILKVVGSTQAVVTHIFFSLPRVDIISE